MPPMKAPKKPVSQRRRIQNQQAQKKYRERQKKHLELLEGLTGFHDNLISSFPLLSAQGNTGAGPSVAASLPHTVINHEQSPSQHDFRSQPNHQSSMVIDQSRSQGNYPTPTFSNVSHGTPAQPPQTPQSLRNHPTDQRLIAPIRELIDSIIQQEELAADEVLKTRILQSGTSVRDILMAGLEALAQKSSSSNTSYQPSPSSEEELRDDDTTKMPTDRLLVLTNSSRRPSERIPDIHRNNLKMKQLMYVAACVENAASLGLHFDSSNCEEEVSPFYRAEITSVLAAASCSGEFAALKPYLRPSNAQLLHPHHPYLDVLPFPTFRERVIQLISSDPPMIDEDDLCDDLMNDGLICWGSTMEERNATIGSGAPWDLRSWEAAPWFMRKWWIVIGGREGEIYQQTKWWREMRGERVKNLWQW